MDSHRCPRPWSPLLSVPPGPFPSKASAWTSQHVKDGSPSGGLLPSAAPGSFVWWPWPWSPAAPPHPSCALGSAALAQMKAEKGSLALQSPLGYRAGGRGGGCGMSPGRGVRKQGSSRGCCPPELHGLWPGAPVCGPHPVREAGVRWDSVCPTTL